MATQWQWQSMMENLQLVHHELSIIIDLINTVETNNAVTVASMTRPTPLPNEAMSDLVVSATTKLQCFRHFGKYFKQSDKALDRQVAREARFYGALIRGIWYNKYGIKNSARRFLRYLVMAKKNKNPVRGGFYGNVFGQAGECSDMSGRINAKVTGLEDSSAPMRKSISLNSSNRDSFGVPIQILPLSNMLSSERKDLKYRLNMENAVNAREANFKGKEMIQKVVNKYLFINIFFVGFIRQ